MPQKKVVKKSYNKKNVPKIKKNLKKYIGG